MPERHHHHHEGDERQQESSDPRPLCSPPPPPSRDRVSFPAEWRRHACCLVLYPHNPEVFRLPLALKEFRNLVRRIAVEGREPVVVYCQDELHLGAVRNDFDGDGSGNGGGDKNNMNNIWFDVCPSDDTWARDTAPTFVLLDEHDDNAGSGEKEQPQPPQTPILVGLDWDFNAYGGPDDGCYWPCERDRKIAGNACRSLETLKRQPGRQSSLALSLIPSEIRHRPVPIVLEGGSIHTDGEGTVLTTEECLLHPNRNPDKTKQEIESTVLRATGCTKMIWLPYGVDGDDDTNGHVDNWACFVAPTQLVLSWTDDDVDDKVNYRRCREALEILEKSTDARGRSLTVHKLYLPKPMYYTKEHVDSLVAAAKGDGDGNDNSAAGGGQQPSVGVPPRQAGKRMAGSYVNFYIANAAVLVPQFGDATYDRKAVELLQSLFPTRKAVGVPSKELMIGGGNIHCLTQQVPAVL